MISLTTTKKIDARISTFSLTHYNNKNHKTLLKLILKFENYSYKVLASAPKYLITLGRSTQNNSESSWKYSTAISSGIHGNVTVISHETLISPDIRILHTLYCFSCIMGPVESTSTSPSGGEVRSTRRPFGKVEEAAACRNHRRMDGRRLPVVRRRRRNRAATPYCTAMSTVCYRLVQLEDGMIGNSTQVKEEKLRSLTLWSLTAAYTFCIVVQNATDDTSGRFCR